MSTVIEPGVLSKVTHHLVDNLDALDECRRWLSQPRDILGCDTESGDTNIWHSPHRMTQIGDLWHGWAFPDGWFGAVNEMLNRYTGRVGYFNAPYDLQVLNRYQGMAPRWERTDDAQLAGHIYSSNATYKNGLKERACEHVDKGAAHLEVQMNAGFAAQGWDYATVPLTYEPYWRYAAQDPVLNCHLLERYLPVVLSQHRASYDLELGYARICTSMMAKGLAIDVPYIQEKIGQVEVYNEQLRAWLRDQWGIHAPGNLHQVAKALDWAGVELTFRTKKTRQPQLDKDTLAIYRARHPQAAGLIDAITWIKKAEQIPSRYLQKFLDLAYSTPDGPEIHYSIHSTGAFHTGRSSVKTPAMQTYDRDLPWIRGSFIPRPGNVLISIDADQIEARFAAIFSGDRQMIADFHEADRTGQSFFIVQAAGIYGEQITKKDPRYTTTKNATYAGFYGSGLETAAATAKVDVDQMRPAYYGIKDRYPGVGRLMNKIIAENRRRGFRRKNDPRPGPYVETLSGKRLYGEGEKLYALLDYKIQGSAAEALKWGCVALDAAGLGDMLRLTVHDEVILECPRGDAEDVLHTASEILTDRDNFAVPITWSGSILPTRWVKT